MNKYTIDFTNCKYIHDIHQAIKIGLQFPNYYGENWSAFWDCITDYGKIKFCIKIIGLEKIQEKFQRDTELLLSCLKEYKYEKNNDLIIKIVYNNEEYELFS